MTKKENEADTSTAIASVADQIRDRIANIDKTTDTPATKNISLKGSKFTLPTGEVSAGPVNCIIVDYANFNAWYEGEYDSNNPRPPDCFATHREINLMAPNPDLVETPVSEACKSCKYNEFGSKGRGKECKNQVILAILPEDFNEDSEIFTIRVAPKGLKRWASYVRTLASQNIDPIQVVTSVSFVEDIGFPSLKFKSLGGNKKLEEINPFLAQVNTVLNMSM